MKILLDEDVPHALRHEFPEHDVRTAQYMGWNGKKNGELLALARDEFDALITLDQNMPEQQNLTEEDVGVLILVAGTDDVEALKALVSEIRDVLHRIRRGQVVHIPQECQ